MRIGVTRNQTTNGFRKDRNLRMISQGVESLSLLLGPLGNGNVAIPVNSEFQPVLAQPAASYDPNEFNLRSTSQYSLGLDFSIAIAAKVPANPRGTLVRIGDQPAMYFGIGGVDLSSSDRNLVFGFTNSGGVRDNYRPSSPLIAIEQALAVYGLSVIGNSYELRLNNAVRAGTVSSSRPNITGDFQINKHRSVGETLTKPSYIYDVVAYKGADIPSLENTVSALMRRNNIA